MQSSCRVHHLCLLLSDCGLSWHFSGQMAWPFIICSMRLAIIFLFNSIILLQNNKWWPWQLPKIQIDVKQMYLSVQSTVNWLISCPIRKYSVLIWLLWEHESGGPDSGRFVWYWHFSASFSKKGIYIYSCRCHPCLQTVWLDNFNMLPKWQFMSLEVMGNQPFQNYLINQQFWGMYAVNVIPFYYGIWSVLNIITPKIL